jgi:hypothetical protein
MTKKLAITYTFLFLFVFTFALSFTLASKTQAQGDICCWLYSCPGYPEYVSEIGHYEKGVCVFNGFSHCDTAYLCP